MKKFFIKLINLITTLASILCHFLNSEKNCSCNSDSSQCGCHASGSDNEADNDATD
ncbi:MAG: hypothetical protein K2M01_07800 [Paramuribaculum sp.]|nr:hypothetical protein [Paramuribaculum sp.]